MTGPLAFFHHFKQKMAWVGVILFIDLVAIGLGWYYYWAVGQFDPSSVYYQAVYWWPLVADSPNAVLLFFVALLLYRRWGIRSHILDSLAFVLNLYVGVWTSFLFLSYPDTMDTWDWGSVNNVLFFAHLGMPLQSLILARDLARTPLHAGIAAGLVAFFALFVYVDYWGPHLHPAPFLDQGGGAGLLHTWSPWIMVASVAAWLALIGAAHLRARKAYV